MGHPGYYLFDDMEKYNPGFERRIYDDKTVAELKEEFKKYYANVLPVDLLTWCRVNEPADKMIYKSGYWDQIMLVRDSIMSLFGYGHDEKNPVMVINTHMSKSIVLPVYRIDLPKYGVTMILRNNFYNWKVSVTSETELDVDFEDVFTEDREPIHSVYCEGFERSQVFGRYCDNNKQFTVEIATDRKLYVFMFLLNRFLKRHGVITDAP